MVSVHVCLFLCLFVSLYVCVSVSTITGKVGTMTVVCLYVSLFVLTILSLFVWAFISMCVCLSVSLLFCIVMCQRVWLLCQFVCISECYLTFSLFVIHSVFLVSVKPILFFSLLVCLSVCLFPLLFAHYFVCITSSKRQHVVNINLLWLCDQESLVWSVSLTAILIGNDSFSQYNLPHASYLEQDLKSWWPKSAARAGVVLSSICLWGCHIFYFILCSAQAGELVTR